jgi:hypothetical protein
VAPQRAGDQLLQLGDRLDAGEPGAGEHEGQPPGGALRRGVGELDLAQHLVAQADRIAHVLDRERVLAQPGHGRHARDRAERDDEVLILDRERAGVGLDAHGARLGLCVRATVVSGRSETRRLDRSTPRRAPLMSNFRRTLRDSGHVRPSYPRRQQLRRLRHAAARALQAAAAVVAAAKLSGSAQPALAVAVLLLAVLLALDGCCYLRLARRSRVGAESETLVRQALEPLEREGWRVRHSLDWPGAGDLDHVVQAPCGIGFVIETKTLRYARAHARRPADAARWLGGAPRRYPCGVRPVICLARARRAHWFEDGVLIVSLDRLVCVLRREARVVSDDGRADVSPTAVRRRATARTQRSRDGATTRDPLSVT